MEKKAKVLEVYLIEREENKETMNIYGQIIRKKERKKERKKDMTKTI